MISVFKISAAFTSELYEKMCLLTLMPLLLIFFNKSSNILCIISINTYDQTQLLYIFYEKSVDALCKLGSYATLIMYL